MRIIHENATPIGKRRILALLLAAAFVWRMPATLGLAADSTALSAHAVSVTLMLGVSLLLRRAFACEDKRLWRCVGWIGLIFGGFVRIGEPLRQNGAFAPFTWTGLLAAALDIALYALVASATLALVYQALLCYTRRGDAAKESLFSRLLGNWGIVFVALLACWLPVWLAFYPGTFAYDSVTQFNEYMYDSFSPHHPLLHTLLLGSCMQFAMDFELEGYATAGVAVYSLVQMTLMSGMLAYACRWLRKRGAPIAARVCVTLLFMAFPFYSLWSFCAQKDVLFGGLVLIFVLQLLDLWKEGFSGLRKPLRIVAFVVTAVLMMLMRNNGIYALVLLLPLLIPLAKGARVRMTLLLVLCVALYLGANSWLIWYLDAEESDAKVEIVSIPLQQIARVAVNEENTLPEEAAEYLEMLYPNCTLDEIYAPYVADPVKWALDSEALELPELLSIWAKVGAGHFDTYVEAFMIQNLPYFLPGSSMQYNLDLGVRQVSEMYELEEHSFLPRLKACYQDYDRTLTLFGLPCVRLMSDTAFFVWLCFGALGLAIYRRQREWIVGMGFLLALWITCLLGPVAIIRYMLGFFYVMPVALAAMLAPEAGESEARKGA